MSVTYINTNAVYLYMPQTDINGTENGGIRLKCTRTMCGHEWIYRGKRRYPQVTSCPSCLGAVRITVDAEGNTHAPRGRGKRIDGV